MVTVSFYLNSLRVKSTMREWAHTWKSPDFGFWWLKEAPSNNVPGKIILEGVWKEIANE